MWPHCRRYVLVGRATRNCLSRGWDGRIPVCEGELNHCGEGGQGRRMFDFPPLTRGNVASSLTAVNCGEPPEVANGELKSSGELSYTYLSVVRYHCRVGTLMGSSEVWCTQDGTWSAPPTCEGVHRKAEPVSWRGLTIFHWDGWPITCKRDICLSCRYDVSPSRCAGGLLEWTPKGVLQAQGQHRHRVQAGLRCHRPQRGHLRERWPLVARPAPVRPHRWVMDTAAQPVAQFEAAFHFGAVVVSARSGRWRN